MFLHFQPSLGRGKERGHTLFEPTATLVSSRSLADKHEQAREHLVTATTMYREMGMTYWLEKAEAAAAEVT